jgi:hypothetical protein
MLDRIRQTSSLPLISVRNTRLSEIALLICTKMLIHIVSLVPCAVEDYADVR